MTEAPPEALPGEIEYLRLPRPAELFRRRAERLRELAPGNPMQDLLLALADMVGAQRAALPLVRPGSAPGDLPAEVPLRATRLRRHADWRAGLGALLSGLRPGAWPAPARAAMGRLAAASPADLEALADETLSGAPGPGDLAAAPFVAAALQVYFASLAAGLPASSVERTRSGCPVCASPPVAGVVLGDDKLRYLACSLCGSEWNLPRIQCWLCRSTAGISYLAVEGGPAGVRAEACSSCRAYVKLFYREQSPRAEPLADDVATLALDLLAAEEGWARSGVNLFLVGGAEH
ncbi:MAG TPA: formate dehydrogenase accessory protein FdhE [Anaeromyxobacteraceae bacterium]|nr:formate dehydrogenase accessory protein FdhE [Anaeromyxobacteraceae bacterium]